MTQALLHYSGVARWLHWTIAALIIVNLTLGISHDWLPKDWAVIPLHESIGFLVLALSLARLVWRLTHPAPPLPAAMPGWEKFSAQVLHWLFYALMIVMPLTGWIFTSAGKWPLGFFWLFEIPKFAIEKGSGLQIATHNAHVWFGYGWAALVVLHIAAALRHQFILKDGVMTRMWRSAPGV